MVNRPVRPIAQAAIQPLQIRNADMPQKPFQVLSLPIQKKEGEVCGDEAADAVFADSGD